MSSGDQLGRSATGNGQQIGQFRTRARGEFGLPRRHIDLMIMQRVQCRGGGRGDPRGIRTRLRMADLLHQHVRHPVRRRPHALADLRLAAQAALQSDIDVLVLIGLDPGVPRMSPLRIIGPASIEVWISSPVRSRKPVLMNTTRSRAAAMQAFRLAEVRRSSSMMPIFSVFAAGPEDSRRERTDRRSARLPPARASWASRYRPSRRGCS
jgi:hypothetical protein